MIGKRKSVATATWLILSSVMILISCNGEPHGGSPEKSSGSTSSVESSLNSGISDGEPRNMQVNDEKLAKLLIGARIKNDRGFYYILFRDGYMRYSHGELPNNGKYSIEGNILCLNNDCFDESVAESNSKLTLCRDDSEHRRGCIDFEIMRKGA